MTDKTKKSESTESTESTGEAQKPVSESTSEQTGKIEKTPDYAKQIADLEKKIGEQGEQMGKMEEFVTGASVVINTIASNTDLKERFTEALNKQMGVQSQQPQQGQTPTNPNTPQTSENKATNEKVDDLVVTERTRIIREFEKDYGIDKLTTEESDAVKKSIGEELHNFGWTLKDLPLPTLRTSLEKAYTLSRAEKLREEGKLEGMAQARENQYGAMNFSGSAPQSQEGVKDLNPKQKEWIKKLGVDEEGAKTTYFDRENEQTRVAKAEKKQ